MVEAITFFNQLNYSDFSITSKICQYAESNKFKNNIFLSPNCELKSSNQYNWTSVGFHKLNTHQDNIINFLEQCQPDSIDSICSVRVLEHFSMDEFLYLNYLMYRVLKSNGCMIHVIPDMTNCYKKFIDNEIDTGDSFWIKKFNIEVFNINSEYDRHLQYTDYRIMNRLFTQEKYFSVSQHYSFDIDNSPAVLIICQPTKSTMEEECH